MILAIPGETCVRPEDAAVIFQTLNNSVLFRKVAKGEVRRVKPNDLSSVNRFFQNYLAALQGGSFTQPLTEDDVLNLLPALESGASAFGYQPGTSSSSRRGRPRKNQGEDSPDEDELGAVPTDELGALSDIFKV
jgi:hypothetical protein